MEIKRDRQTAYDIAQIIKALDDFDDKMCNRFVSCNECPLNSLGLFDTRTCYEITQLVNRLDLAYRVVETI